MAMKKFYVGVKGIIHDENKGVLLLKDPRIIDVPGGRIDDNEMFEETLQREIQEELPGAELQSIGELLGASRIPKDVVQDTSLVLLYYKVAVNLPELIVLSDEHDSYFWVQSVQDIPPEANPDLVAILTKLLE